MARVFLAHSSADKPFALRLRKDLDAHGVDVWLDQTTMSPGDPLPIAIRKGVQECRFLVAILSPDSVASPWVNMEVAQALEDGHRDNYNKVIPVLFRECPPQPAIPNILWCDLSSPDKYWDGLFNLLEVVQPGTPTTTMHTLTAPPANLWPPPAAPETTIRQKRLSILAAATAISLLGATAYYYPRNALGCGEILSEIERDLTLVEFDPEAQSRIRIHINALDMCDDLKITQEQLERLLHDKVKNAEWCDALHSEIERSIHHTYTDPAVGAGALSRLGNLADCRAYAPTVRKLRTDITNAMEIGKVCRSTLQRLDRKIATISSSPRSALQLNEVVSELRECPGSKKLVLAKENEIAEAYLSATIKLREQGFFLPLPRLLTLAKKFAAHNPTVLNRISQVRSALPPDLAKAQVEQAAQRYRKTPSVAFELAGEVAAESIPEGHEALGYFYAMGIGVQQNATKALEQYRLAAEGERIYAMCAAGVLAAENARQAEDPAQAQKWLNVASTYWQDAANRQDAFSASNLAWLWQSGGLGEAAQQAAEPFVEQAARAGNLHAQHVLFTLHPTQHLSSLKNAAERNYLPSMLALAEAYLAGTYGISPDSEKAIQWYVKAAELGSAKAARKLATLYEFGVKNIPFDADKTEQWERLARDLDKDETNVVGPACTSDPW